MLSKYSDVDHTFQGRSILSKRVLLVVGHVSLCAVSTQILEEKHGRRGSRTSMWSGTSTLMISWVRVRGRQTHVGMTRRLAL
jgi:hypothetical protein